jgi:hypothetical protein
MDEARNIPYLYGLAQEAAKIQVKDVHFFRKPSADGSARKPASIGGYSAS